LGRGGLDHGDFLPRVFHDHIEFIQVILDHGLNIGHFAPQHRDEDDASQQGEDAEHRGYGRGEFHCHFLKWK
jgi:hypothetical protein